MKTKTLIVTMILVCMFAIPAMAANATMTGTITDDMCGAKHMMSGKDEASCIRACVKEGAKYALMADGGKMFVLVGMQPEVSALAGQKVTVSGTVKDNTVTLSSVEKAK